MKLGFCLWREIQIFLGDMIEKREVKPSFVVIAHERNLTEWGYIFNLKEPHFCKTSKFLLRKAIRNFFFDIKA